MNRETELLTQKLVDTLSDISKNETKPYDVEAEVIRIDGNIAWVHIPGGVKETPVQLTINAKKGDKVRLRVSGGTAWITGNISSPPTDDAVANVAKSQAVKAYNIADDAYSDASIAKEAANNAVESASEAKLAADTANDILDDMKADAQAAGIEVDKIYTYSKSAKTNADEAKTAATDASAAAKSAYGYATAANEQLSIVENVVGTIEWIQRHGIYAASSDTSVVDGKVYYTLSGSIIASPTGNPHKNKYYERSGSGTSESPYLYTLSSDTNVDSLKTYYGVMPTSVVNPSGDPSTIPYYDLSVDEAVVEYVNTHLSLTDAGLIVTDGSANSMLISSSGVKIYNSSGVIAEYGQDVILGKRNSYHIEVISGDGTQANPPRLRFMSSESNEVAYMTAEQLFIKKVVVVNSMQAGNWLWDAKTDANHFTLRYSPQ